MFKFTFSGITLTELQIILIAAGIGLWLFIYTPLAIYHSRKYYANRNHVVYRARYASITIYEATFVVIKLLYSCFANAAWVYMIDNNECKWYPLIAQIVDIFDTILAYFVIYTWIWRIWMISYNMIWINSIMNHEWKSIINMSYNDQISIASSSSTANWYILNKKTFGNYNWVKWRLFLMVILSSTFNVSVDIFSVLYWKNNEENAYIFQLTGSIPCIIPYVVLIYIYCIMPSFIDNFYVLLELKLMFLCLCFDYFVGYMSYMLFMAFYHPLTTDVSRIAESISFHLVLFAQFIELMVSTWWVNNRVKNIINEHRYKEIKTHSSHSQSVSLGGISYNIEESLNKNLITFQAKKTKTKIINSANSSSNNNEFYDKTRLKDILGVEYGIESFINHLSSEFSLECILSLIEFCQFQSFIAEKSNYKQKQNNNPIIGSIGGSLSLLTDEMRPDYRLFCNVILFPNSIPKSQIVYDDTINLREKSFKLYQKYIQTGSEFEINLSFDAKKKLIGIFESDNYNNIIKKDRDLLNIFTESCRQMMLLMQDSFNRWKKTQQYQKIINSIRSLY